MRRLTPFAVLLALLLGGCGGGGAATSTTRPHTPDLEACAKKDQAKGASSHGAAVKSCQEFKATASGY